MLDRLIKHKKEMVPAAGLEPARAKSPTDFKSVMSTNSITQALKIRTQKLVASNI